MKNAWAVCGLLAIGLVATIFISRSMLDQKDAELSSLRQQYNQVVQDANNKLQEANKKYGELVDDANKKIELANQLEVPVNASFRPAFLGSGYVAQVTNTSGGSIAVTIVAQRPSSGKTANFETVLDGGATKEIGEHEGWAFVSGDTLTVEQASHKSLVFSMR